MKNTSVLEGHKARLPVDGLAVLSQRTQQFESIDRNWVWLLKQRLVPKERVTIQLGVINNDISCTISTTLKM